MNQTMNHASEGSDIDALLTRFFRAEMPAPWPTCEALTRARQAARRRHKLRAFSRFALAASVVLFFAGYLTISSFFPRPQANPTQDPNAIGSVPGHTHKLHQPGLPQK